MRAHVYAPGVRSKPLIWLQYWFGTTLPCARQRALSQLLNWGACLHRTAAHTVPHAARLRVVAAHRSCAVRTVAHCVAGAVPQRSSSPPTHTRAHGALPVHGFAMAGACSRQRQGFRWSPQTQGAPSQESESRPGRQPAATQGVRASLPCPGRALPQAGPHGGAHGDSMHGILHSAAWCAAPCACTRPTRQWQGC